MTKTKRQPTGLPRGAGMLDLRGRSWWMIYWADGHQVQENSGTEDYAMALHKLGALAIERWQAAITVTQEVLRATGPGTDQGHGDAGAGRPSRRGPAGAGAAAAARDRQTSAGKRGKA